MTTEEDCDDGLHDLKDAGVFQAMAAREAICTEWHAEYRHDAKQEAENMKEIETLRL
jgi:hypothetical protein